MGLYQHALLRLSAHRGVVAAIGVWVLLLDPSAQAAADAARVGDSIITTQQLDARTSHSLTEKDASYQAQLAQLQLNYERSRQAYVERELNLMIDDRVLELESATQGSSPAALTAAIKAGAISDEDQRKFYDANKDRIGQPYEQVSARIATLLQKQAMDQARRNYLDALRVKYRVLITLPPRREQVPTDGPARGAPSAVVTIVEFSDFECPFCGAFEPVVSQAMAKYAGKVRLIYKNYPLTNVHPHAQKAAEAAWCAQDQGKFWEMHDALFAEQSALEVHDLKDKAQRVGLNPSVFDDCLDGGKSRTAVQADVRAGELLGIGSTPTTFVNGRFIDGGISLEALSTIIDDELHRGAPTARR